ncbi:MAG TPA: MiaB/RimO family radical SAM methylthiotransferase, partial [Nocardioidaceae bacterium]|nr:MiaB/RimO family radical SAM methylthiotransferase [Nocardioidaceae bacterium]
VAPYFDLSFQHAAGPLLRRMRRFGDAEQFLQLLETIRSKAPESGVRSNFIVGFPGETDEDVRVLCDFLTAAELDAVGIFGYSNEDGTEAATMDQQFDANEIRDRVDVVTRLADELTAQRAERRHGEVVEVLIESVGDGEGGPTAEGRALHQGPDVDGSTSLTVIPSGVVVGDVVSAVVVGNNGADLVADPT